MTAHRRFRTLLLPLFVLTSVVAVGCGGSADQTSATTTTATTAALSTTSTTAASTTTTASTALPQRSLVRVYYLRGEKVGPVAREAVGVATASEAVDALLVGPTAEERKLGFSTAIPAGTSRLGVSIENRIATVDFSPQFASGGGSASMQARVAQVVFTLTQFPAVDAVEFMISGAKVTALGGEGLLLERPQGRADWEDLSPAVLVESPLPQAEVSSPLRIAGTANTFEATFHINLIDARGRVVYDRYATATSGSGTRGTFDITAAFKVSQPGLGSLVVFEYSAEDGSKIHIVEIPIKLSVR